jgi:hypothetical protein
MFLMKKSLNFEQKMQKIFDLTIGKDTLSRLSRIKQVNYWRFSVKTLNITIIYYLRNVQELKFPSLMGLLGLKWGVQKLTGDNLKLVWAEFSAIS